MERIGEEKVGKEGKKEEMSRGGALYSRKETCIGT